MRDIHVRFAIMENPEVKAQTKEMKENVFMLELTELSFPAPSKPCLPASWYT